MIAMRGWSIRDHSVSYRHWHKKKGCSFWNSPFFVSNFLHNHNIQTSGRYNFGARQN